MKNLLLITSIFFISLSMHAQEITGDWFGVLEIQGQKLRLVYHISQEGDQLNSTMDSPDQGVKGIPMGKTTFKQDTLVISAPNMMMKYTGTLNAGEIQGEYQQGGIKLPLHLTQKEIKVNRPQAPKKPYPYIEEEVTFKNIKDTVTLAGTLTKPKGLKNFPTVILISGSGPQNRNEELMDHQPFLVLADYLTRNGIAVLRYDDRGVGASSGRFETSTIYDFAEDTKAAVSYLSSRKDIDPEKIILLGHSEGGVVAPLVASKDKKIAGIILLAGPGARLDKVLLQQQKDIYNNSGMSQATVDSIINLNKGFYDIVNSVDRNQINKEFLNYGKSKSLSNIEITKQIESMSGNWFYSFITYDPKLALQQVSCPVLALNGAKDMQVNASQNLNAIKENLAQGGNKNVTIKEMEGLNHLFQEANTGMPNEYAQIEETMSPEVMGIIKNWILGR